MRIADGLGVGVFAVVSVGTASLGVWQLQRRQEKIAAIAERHAQLTAPSQVLQQLDPVPAPFSRVTLPPSAVYQGPDQFLVGPRAGPVSVTGRGKGTGLSAGGLGYYVIAPFSLPSGALVLVNRGWCRRDAVVPALASIGNDAVAGSAGIVRPSEYTSADLTPHPSSNVFVRLDAEGMASRSDPDGRQAPPAFFIDLLDDGSASSSSPLRRRSVPDFLRFNVMPEAHASYALTWFALSAASAIIATLKVRQGRSTTRFGR